MSREEKIVSKKNQKRERIIEAASVLFSEKNFHEVMMDDVARLAGIAKGTLYNYYNSKEDLYFSIMLQRMQNLILSLNKKISRESDTVDSLRSFTVHNYLFMLKYRCFFLMMQKDTLQASNSYCEDLKVKKTELREMLVNIINNGRKEGAFGNVNADFGSDLVLGSIDAAVSRAINKNYSQEEVRSEKEQLFDFLIKGLTGSVVVNLPLQGKTVVITRSSDDSRDSALKFERLGAKVIPFPAIEIIPVSSWNNFDSALERKWDLLIFTSANSVRMFSLRLKELGRTIDYSRLLVIAVGSKTADECKRYSISVNMVPNEFSGKGIASELSGYDLKGKVIFIPGSAVAREELPELLKTAGAEVITAAVYEVTLPPVEISKKSLEELSSLKPDLYVFTSPSTFRNFLKIAGITEPEEYFNGSAIAAIGPTTKNEIEKSGLKVLIMPKEYTMEALAKSAAEYFSKKEVMKEEVIN